MFNSVKNMDLFKSKKTVKVNEDKFNALIAQFNELKEQNKALEVLSKEMNELKQKNNDLQKRLDEVDSLEINRSTIIQRDNALQKVSTLEAELNSLRIENRCLKTSNTSNELLLKESLTTLRAFSNTDDVTHLIDEII